MPTRFGLRYISPLIVTNISGVSFAVTKEKAFNSPCDGKVSKKDCRNSGSMSRLAVCNSMLDMLKARAKIFFTSGMKDSR